MELSIGQDAPDFTLSSTTNEQITLSSYRGKQHVLLAFFPAAFTGGWARELATLRADWKKFEEADAQVLGISTDSRHSLNQFGSSLGGLPFPLLADFYPHGSVAEQYGAFNAESGQPRRVCVIIDKLGKVQLVQTYPPGFPDDEELLQCIKGIPG